MNLTRSRLMLTLGAALFTLSAHAASGDASRSPLADADRTFLENATQGSHAEVQGSQLAQDKSQNADVKEFAATMIKDHSTMIKELAELSKSKGYTPPDGPSIMQATELKALSALSGEAFDKMYVDRIGVASHEATIEQFEEATKEVQDADVKALAEKSLPKLRHHLEMAQALNEKQKSQ
jgi:putative membrane protein